MLERMCQRLAKEWEVEDSFISDTPGVWIIPLDGEVDIVLSAIERGFMISAVLGPSPQQQREDFFTLLMTANFLGQGTQGAVLALDEKNQITLSQSFTEVVTQRDFQEAVEDFISNFDRWKALISSAKTT
jgi:hypothetical protein